MKTCRFYFIQLKLERVFSQVSMMYVSSNKPLISQSLFTQNVESQKLLPCLPNRLLQGQAELTRVLWTNHTILDGAVHISRGCFPFSNILSYDLSVLSELVLRVWYYKLRRVGPGENLYIHILHCVTYRECLKFTLEKDNPVLNLSLLHYVFHAMCSGHSYPSPNSTQIYTPFPTHPTSSPPFSYPSDCICAVHVYPGYVLERRWFASGCTVKEASLSSYQSPMAPLLGMGLCAQLTSP